MPGGRVIRWTEADDCALMELRDSCSLEQVAAYLGRPVGGVIQRQTKLRRKGMEIGDGRKHRNPFHIPRGASLLGKTCPSCGLFRDASHFAYQKINRAHASKCRSCTKNATIERYGKYRRSANTELLQEITFAQASNEKMRYTSDELVTLKDLSKSDFEVALTLGRSFYAIQNKRSKSGLLHKKPRQDKGEWMIQFPEAQLVLQDHFKNLGRAVPEELWEW